MFQYLPEQYWIAVDEPDVLRILRSKDSRPLADDPVEQPAVQVFLVMVRRDRAPDVYLAFHLEGLRRNVVYRLSEPARDGSRDELIRLAAAELERRGIVLQEMNLQYGTAMREVVIRDIPVVLPVAAVSKAEKQRTERLAELRRQAKLAEQEAEEEEVLPAGREDALAAARKRNRQARLLEAREAETKLAEEDQANHQLALVKQLFEADLGEPEKSVPAGTAATGAAAPADRSANGGDEEFTAPGLDRVRLEVAHLDEAARKAADQVESERSSRERIALEKAALEKNAVQLAEAARLAAAKAEAGQEEIERLRARQAEADRLAREAGTKAEEAVRSRDLAAGEQERLVRQKEDAERRAEELGEAARKAVARARAERAEKEALEAAKSAAEQQSAELSRVVREIEDRLSTERFERERLAAEKAEAEKRLGELTAMAQKVAERTGQERIEREQLAAERASRERLAAEKAVLERRAAELAESVRKATEAARQERRERERLAAEQTRYEGLLKEKTALENRAAELAEKARKAAEEAEQERRRRERLLAEQADQGRLLAEKAALEKRAEKLSREAKEAARQLAAEREARQRLEAAKAEAEERLKALPPDRDHETPKTPTSFSAASRAPAKPAGASVPVPQARRRPVPGAFFNVDWDLHSVTDDPVREIVELHQSINMVQLSLEGFPNQYCSAYILGLKRAGGLTVHVVLRLIDSRHVLIYVPDKPPTDRATYARALQEAHNFLRVVGMDTERIPLPASAEAREKILAGIPVFSA